MRFLVVVTAGIVCLSMTAALPAADDQPATPAHSAVATSTKMEDPEATKNLEMAEDLEIMGVVLRSALTVLYADWCGPRTAESGDGLLSMLIDSEHLQREQRGVDPAAALPQRRPSDARSFSLVTEGPSTGAAVLRPEGAYLDGYGVVYQVTLDAPAPQQRPAKDTVEKGDERKLGPVQIEMLEALDVLVLRGHQRDVDQVARILAGATWDGATRRLRGQPPSRRARDADGARRMPTRDDLVDKLLDVLAENAGNFRHLKLQDRLTVALTFSRSKTPTTPAGVSNTMYTMIALQNELTALEIDPAEGRTSQEVSGDLHMRQKNYQKAIEAYSKAMHEGDLSSEKKRSIQIKLTQAYVAADDLETAQKWITFLTKTRAEKSGNQNGTSSEARWQVVPLPARLVVSIPKSRLDEVAAGKLKREELSRHATIQYFNPPPDRPGLGSRKSRTASSPDKTQYQPFNTSAR